ncbi:papilin-like [Amblyomma americanum]
MLEVSSHYFDAQRSECRAREDLGKGCLNDSNGFDSKSACEGVCVVKPNQAEQAEVIASDVAAHEIRQRSQRRPRRFKEGRNTSSNGTGRQPRTSVDAAAILFEQPAPTKDWTVPPAQGWSKCRKVILETCVPSEILPSWVFDPDSSRCLEWNYSKGCYRNSKIFMNENDCLYGCKYGTPPPNTCLRAVVGEACDESLHVRQWFYNPLSSACENLSQLCLAGRNRFPNYAACTETCLARADPAARQVVVKEGRTRTVHSGV